MRSRRTQNFKRPFTPQTLTFQKNQKFKNTFQTIPDISFFKLFFPDLFGQTKVFRDFRKKNEELHTNGRHQQILHEKLRDLTIFQLRTTLNASSCV